MKVATIGLDPAKQISQVDGADKMGQRVLRRKLKRSELVRFFSELASCLAWIEASGDLSRFCATQSTAAQRSKARLPAVSL